jgi:tetratricopeptide (TPR) repeat protein
MNKQLLIGGMLSLTLGLPTWTLHAQPSPQIIEEVGRAEANRRVEALKKDSPPWWLDALRKHVLLLVWFGIGALVVCIKICNDIISAIIGKSRLPILDNTPMQLADYIEVIRLDPQNPKAYNNRGWYHTEKGEHDKAIADYTEAIRIDSKYSAAFYKRGLSHAQKGEHDKAIADYTQAIQLNPTQHIFYVNRANAYRALGDETKAASDEQKAQELKK